MSVTANVNLLVNVDETFNTDALVNQILTHAGYNATGLTLNGDSTPPVTKVSAQDYALSSGTKTIDLTALLGVNDLVQDCTGLKLQLLVFINAAGNADMTISGEGADGYSLGAAHVVNGSTIATRTIMYLPEALADVSSSVKNLVVTGTGSQTFKLLLLLG